MNYRTAQTLITYLKKKKIAQFKIKKQKELKEEGHIDPANRCLASMELDNIPIVPLILTQFQQAKAPSNMKSIQKQAIILESTED